MEHRQGPAAGRDRDGGLGPASWGQFAHDPRDPAHASLRLSDRDRAAAADLLGEAYAEGRLSLEEHHERLDRAGAAVHLGEVVPLLEDLVPRLTPARGRELARATPDELRTQAQQRWAAERRQALLAFLGPSLICWAVYAALVWGDPWQDWQLPWPLIVSVATLLNLLRVQVTRADIVAARLESLERRQAKELARAPRRAPGPRERLDPEAVRQATEAARRVARDAARTVEQDVVRRFNRRWGPPGPPAGPPGPS